MAKYYYLDSERNQRGPVEVSELVGLGVNRSTLVWTEGMGDWVPAASVGELSHLFTPAPPPVYQAQVQPTPGEPANYVHTNWLVWSILATIFCCLIGGVVAIIYSANANSAYAAGRIEEAKRANNQAKTWFWVSFGVGLFVGVIYTIYSLAFAASLSAGLFDMM